MGRVSLPWTGKLWTVAFFFALLPLLGFSAAPPAGDHVAGAGEAQGWRFDVGAESRADGTGAGGYLKGQTTDRGRPVTISGKVTCLWVSGHSATIGATIDRSSEPALVGGSAILTVYDGGAPVGGRSPDMASPVAPFTQPPTEAQCSTAIVGLSSIEHGNVEVKDA